MQLAFIKRSLVIAGTVTIILGKTRQGKAVTRFAGSRSGLGSGIVYIYSVIFCACDTELSSAVDFKIRLVILLVYSLIYVL